MNMWNLINEMFTQYLVNRNLEATLSLLTENIMSIGTGEHETALNKDELRDLMSKEFEELPNSFEYTINNYHEVKNTDSSYTVFANVTATLNDAGENFEMDTRFTASCCLENSEWKIAALHMSTPTQIQENEEFFPLKYGRKVLTKMSHDSNVQLLELITKALPGGIMGGYLEEGYPLYVINEKMLEILGYTYDELIHATDEKMINVIHEGDRERVELSIEEQMSRKNNYEVEYRLVCSGGRVIWVNDIGRKVITEEGREAMISIMTDITDRVKREAYLAAEASTDPLTFLFNRKEATRLIESHFDNGEIGTLIICDIDNFKSLNDTEGHLKGDEALIFLARLMDSKFSEPVVVSRLGGDEYMLFFPEEYSMEHIVDDINTVRTEFAKYMNQAYPNLKITLSAGIAERKPEEVFKSIYRRADEALYTAKRSKNNIHIYE